MEEKRIIQLDSASGPMLFEATVRSAPVADGFAEGAEGIAVAGLPKMEDMWELVGRFAQGADRMFSGISPTSLAVEVSVGLEGETGKIPAWVLGKAKGTASVTVALTWGG